MKTLIAKNRGGVNARRKMQKVIMSTSDVNEVLSRNAACAIQGLRPLLYKRCKKIWEDVWGYTMANRLVRHHIQYKGHG